MIKKLIILLILICLAACRSNKPVENDNLTADIKDNISDNKSTQNETADETVIDIFTGNNDKIVTKIYKTNSKNISENKENSKILQILSKYNDNKCINWIAEALKQYNINDNIADTYIKYDDIYLYEPVVLHIGLICENIDVINLLIDFGADIYAEDRSGENMLILAEKINNEEIIKIITEEYENGF